MIVFPKFPHDRVLPVEREVSERCPEFGELTESRQKELATTAVAMTVNQSAGAVAAWRAALEAAEVDPARYIRESIDDPAWAGVNRGAGLGAWMRNVLDAYARIRTSEVGLGRCTEITPFSSSHVQPLPATHLERAQKLSEAILEEARASLGAYEAGLQGDGSHRDWRKHAEDELFDLSSAMGLSQRAAAKVACHLVVAAAESLSSHSPGDLDSRIAAARSRGRRRRKE
ncbi:MAG: hypothetical protein CMN30_31225 [Sandaracinus sp.]|nr:hypothetical protein [Sandaracinus sp.]|tara:strand:- start:4218 stop:4904 length:687 start_codon:yes stop_codon:yes gene_type:complete